MYRILEDEQGNYWVAKITDNRVVLQKGGRHNIDKVPNTPGHVGYLKDYREGREVIFDIHRSSIFL
jgi:hypothetical protein